MNIERERNQQNDPINRTLNRNENEVLNRRRLFECFILIFVSPAALALYLLLQSKLPTTASIISTAIALPMIHSILVGLVLLVYTPRQYVSTMLLALELAVSMLGAMLYDYATLPTLASIIGLGIACYVFWHLVIHALLSVKGVKLEEMGCMGDIGSWIAIISRGIKRMWVWGLRNLSECDIGCDNLHRDEEASPPPYHFSTFSEKSERKGQSLV